MINSENTVKVALKRLEHAEDLPIPERGSKGSAGLDLRAAVETEIVLDPGAHGRIPTGLILEIPPGWEGQVRPRSGLAAKHAITLTNSPGTIDSDYRGEVQVLLINHGLEPFRIRRGDRIAQLVIAPVVEVEWNEQNTLEPTERGGGGFGSTGRS